MTIRPVPRSVPIVRPDLLVGLTILIGGGLIVGAAIMLSPLIAVAATCALFAVATICVWPIVGIIAFAFVGAMFPFAAPGGESITVAEAFLVITWGAVLLNFFIGRLAVAVGPTERAVLWLLAFSLIPCILGILLIPEGKLGMLRWLRWVVDVSAVLLVTTIVREEREVWAVLAAVIIGTAAMLLISVVIYIPHRDARDFIPLLKFLRYSQMHDVIYSLTSFHERMGSTWIHPNTLGGFLAMVVPVSCMILLVAREPRRSAVIFFVLLALVGVFLSISRAAMVGIGSSLLWFVKRRVPYSVGALVVAVVVAVALTGASPRVQDRLAHLFSVDTASGAITSIGTRLDEYRHFPNAVTEYPFGIGFAVEPSTFVLNKPELRQISNLWLNYIYRISVIGMLLYIWATLRWWREVKPPRDVSYADPLSALHVGMVGSLLGTFVIGLFDHYFGFQVVLIAFWWMFVGLTLVTGRRLRASPPSAAAPPRTIAESAGP